MPITLTQICAQFQEERQRLASLWEANHDPQAYLRAHTAVLDQAIRSMIALHALPRADIAIIAVGGYGRAELFPFSDIDLLVLTTDACSENTEVQDKISAFVTELWELRLTVGASVRSVSSFLSEAANDVSIATTYLESRCLWGNTELYRQSRQRFMETLDARRFFRDKMLELARRHQKFEDTPYSLEPNLKESPGGLRDLQVFLWCAQAAGVAESVTDMKTAGLITEREMHTLMACARHLETLRISLHLITKRAENRLLFDVQEELAKSLGYTETQQLRPSEALMKRYYLNAKRSYRCL